MDLSALGHALKPALMIVLLPPVPMIALIVIGGLLLRRRPRAGQAITLLACLALWLSSSEGMGQWLNHHLLRTPASLDTQAIVALHEESKRSADVAVLVLGAGVRGYVPEYLGSSLQPLTLERLRYGIWLARKLEAPLGFTGGIGWSSRRTHISEASVVARVAREEFGLPLRWAEGQARDTRENASLTLPLLASAGIHKLVLVTHEPHMPRAMQAFMEANRNEKGEQVIEVIAAPVGLVADGMSEVQDWCPSEAGFEQVRYTVYEWLGRLAGH